MNSITVTDEDGRSREIPEGTRVGDLPEIPEPPKDLPYIAALVNNDVASLSYPLTVNSKVRFLTMGDSHGWRIYRHSLCFLLAKTVRDLYPSAPFTVEHSFGRGIYCSFRKTPTSPPGMSSDELLRLEEAMCERVRRDLPIERRKISFTEAVRQLEDAEQHEKLSLLKYRNPPRIVMHVCDGFCDLAHGPLAPRTGVLTRFKLVHYPPGFVLDLPPRANPYDTPPFQDQPHLFHIIQEHKAWGHTVGVTTVGRLNEITSSGELEGFVWAAEALHERRLGRIADRIAADRGRIKVVLIAGPSSAGKTTFAKRLTTHLMVNGLRPLTLALDDYFVGPKRNPRDEKGNPDYEHIEAVDLPLFNRDLKDLVDGKEIEVPSFNFVKKEREYDGRTLRAAEDQIIMLEGIHGLNPRLTEKVPTERKFKIYVSALTQLNIDAHNRISTTDNRLIRRMVRDRKFRGHSALDTLRLWPNVRRGEKRWIFPFQQEADVAFNSALDYELAVLKPLVEPFLMEVKPSEPEYAEARRLTEFLLSFLGASDRSVPGASILREYIGGSLLHY